MKLMKFFIWIDRVTCINIDKYILYARYNDFYSLAFVEDMADILYSNKFV